MIEMMVVDTFDKIGHRWNTDNGKIRVSDEDVKKVLDHAATVLYDGDVGDKLSVGGLIIEKRPKGYAVYVYLGNYQ